MQLGMIGLGRMGGNMVRRLQKAGHQCVVFDHNPDTVKQIANLLAGFDYVGAIFADDQFGAIPGALARETDMRAG